MPQYKRYGNNGNREVDFEPIEYRGYQIYSFPLHIDDFGITGPLYEIVLDGVCVSQCTGPNGAKAEIDKIILDKA